MLEVVSKNLEQLQQHLHKPSLTPQGLEELAALPHYKARMKIYTPNFSFAGGVGKEAEISLWCLDRVGQLLMIWSRSQWGSWPQSLSVSLISLTTRNKLHSASLTFPEFQLTASSSY